MKLTADERRRMFETQQKAREDLITRLHAPIPVAGPSAGPHHAIRRLIKPAMIVLLLGSGLLAYQTFDFHLPNSLMEALLPRL
ncbi:MAG: hypothetical protein ACREM3_02465 [Candidatus Rokuibacteriota bacterium]